MFRKIALAVVLILFIALSASAYWIYNNGEVFIEEYVKVELQSKGSEALGVKVSLDDFELSLDKRVATFKNLEIANPEGFDKPYALKAKSLSIALGDISSDLIVIKSMNIGGTTVNYTAQAGGSNLTRIRQNLEAYQEKKAAQPKENSILPDFKLPDVIIDQFYFEGAKIYPKMALVAGRGLGTDITLSEIELKDIGRDQNGVEIGEATAEILKTFNGRVRTAVARAGLYEGLTQMALMGVTGGIPVIGVADEILGLIGLGGDDDDDDYSAARAEPKKLSETLNN